MSDIGTINPEQPDWNRFDRVTNISYFRIGIACVGLLSLALSASAQDFVSPGVNTNLIAVTPEDNVPDYSHKQQQEPSCIIRPSNSSYIFCAFNDLRASDDPAVQGDSWIGFSMSSDIGNTFNSGLVPGFKGHHNSLNMGFAADASLVAVPGADPGQVGGNATKQSPGLAILNYIGGYRDSNVGVLAIQRFVENEQEDQLPWLPEDEIYIVADGTSGRFIDKPAFLFVPDDAGAQRTTTESIVVEGLADAVSVSTPTGTLIVAYAVFTGNISNSIKVMIQRSTNNGRTWEHATKLSESLNEVTGVTLTAIGQGVVASWRQKADGNNGDAVMSAFSSNAGRKWTKGEVMFALCPFDQPATGVTFRTFAFPWAANDGKRYWTFATDRRFKTEGGDITSCDVTPGAPPSIYEGVPRIVGMSSADGVNWVGASGPVEPFVLDSNLLGGQPGGKPIGLQVMPSAFGTKGHIDIAWYDTRREAEEGLPGHNPLPLINDYWGAEADADGNITSLAMVVRKADVWMTRLSANCGTGGGCMPAIETPVRVSRYPVTFFDDGAGNATPFETEAHLPNHKLYASGTLAFKGDYISVASPALRKNSDGQWIPNHAACGTSDIPGGCINKEDIFVAWGDNRDVRIDYDYLKFNSDGGQVPFTPPPTQAASLGFNMGEKKSGASEPLVDVKPEMAAVTESDDSTDPSVPQDDILTCTATTNFGRSRDANVYGAVIADAASLVAPTLSKPLGSIQRTFPLILNNPDVTKSKNFCLQIANQPTGFPSAARASFLQLPSSPSPVPPLEYLPVSVPPGSSASRALYVVAPQGSIVRVKAFEDFDDAQAQACLDLNDSGNNSNYNGALQDTIAISDGNLFDSEYCSLPENAGLPACIPPVVGAGEDETHNISLALANLQSPVLAAPISGALNLQNLNLQAPPLAALNFQNLNFQNLNFQNLNLQNLNFQNLNFQNLNLQNLNFQNLNFQNLNFQNLNLQNLNLQNLNLQNLNFQNLNLQNLNFQNLNLQNLNLQNLNLQNLNFQNLNLQAPALSGGDEGDTGEVQIYEAVTTGGDVWYQDITYIVETDANVTTTYTSDIALNLDMLKASPEDPDEAVVQLIAWTPNEYNDGTDDCGSAVKFEAQVISAVTLKSSNLADVNLPTTIAPTNQNPYEGEVSFTSKPGQAVGLTVRIWATDAARTALQSLYSEWESCANDDISLCENEGIGGLISFGASAQSCQTSDTNNLDGVTDCLNNNFEKIRQDREPPSVNPINPPDGFTPNSLPYNLEATESELKVIWPITGTDSDPTNVTFECTIGGLGPFYPDGAPVLGVETFEVTFTYYFSAGTTPVSCAITDGNGNTTVAAFDVVVNDITGPVITVPALLPFDANPFTGKAIVNYSVSAIDAVAGNVAVSCAPASGSAFSVGTTTVACTATDGTTSSGTSFDVIVNDVTGPVITVPATITASADALTGTAVVTYTVGADDAVVSGVLASCTPASGSAFSVGTTTVACTATDGTTSSDNSFDIIVNDVTGPVITVPATITASADALTGTAVVTYTVSANDTVVSGVLASCTPASGSSFSVGTTTVACTATDGTTSSGNSFDVIVNDVTGPVITVPATITVSANALTGTAVVTYAVSANDAVLGGVLASCTPASGSAFSVGTTTVACTATDGTNSSGNSFDVIVNDVTGPVITVPATITASADVLTGTAVVTYAVSANDAVIGDVPASCTPASGSAFSVGTTTVACTATDGTTSSGNSFDVIVNDVTGPVITALDREVRLDYVDPAYPIWGQVQIDYAAGVTAEDAVDGTVTGIICTPDPGAQEPNPNPDVGGNLGEDDFIFSDEAYLINCSVTDSNGQQGTATYNLTVNYLYDINLIPPKGQARAGSTVPLDWQYSDLNGLIDSSGISVAVSWAHMADDKCLTTPDPLPTDGISSFIDTDSGNSDFRYSSSNDTWQFSWQSPEAMGPHKVSIAPPGANVKDAWECIILR